MLFRSSTACCATPGAARWRSAGDTADPTTLENQIAKLRERFALERVVLVTDRGVLTSARIDQELRPVDGLDWMAALRGGQIRTLAADDGPLRLSLLDQRDLAAIRHPDFPSERLIACMNPMLRAERARKREDLLQATERELDKIVAAVGHERRPLRGAGRIGERVGRVIDKYKMAKHFETDIAEASLRYRRKSEAIEAEARLDGIYVIRTLVSTQILVVGDPSCARRRAFTQRPRHKRSQGGQRGEIHLGARGCAHRSTGRPVEHPERNFLPAARGRPVKGAPRASRTRLPNDVTDPVQAAAPGMPPIKHPAGAGPMGGLALGCTTPRGHTARSGAKTPAQAYRGDPLLDMMDKPLRALPTSSQAQQQRQGDRFKGILAA